MINTTGSLLEFFYERSQHSNVKDAFKGQDFIRLTILLDYSETFLFRSSNT